MILIIPIIVGVSFITCFLSDVAGDPLAPYVTPSMLPLTDETEAMLREKYGLNKPWPVRYLDYIINLVQGNWGDSYAFSSRGTPVLNLIGTVLPATIELGITAMVLALSVGIPVGIFSAWGKYPRLNRLLNSISIIGMGVR